jgi:hypothetical protein
MRGDVGGEGADALSARTDRAVSIALIHCRLKVPALGVELVDGVLCGYERAAKHAQQISAGVANIF